MPDVQALNFMLASLKKELNVQWVNYAGNCATVSVQNETKNFLKMCHMFEIHINICKECPA